MKKKVSVGTTVAVALLAALLTFQITYVATTSETRTGYENGASSYSDNSAVSAIAGKISELDRQFRDNYISDLDADTLADYAAIGYVAGTGDKYAEYLNAEDLDMFLKQSEGESEGIGINVIYDSEHGAFEVVSVMPDTPAEKAGVEVGDLIVHIGAGDAKEDVGALGYTVALSKLRGKKGTEAVFTVCRGDDLTPVDFRIIREEYVTTTVYGRVYSLDPQIGVIRITSFDGNTPEQFENTVDNLLSQGCDRFIMDVRGNPGGTLTSIVSILDYLLPEGPIIRIFDKDDTEVQRYTSDAECVDFPMTLITDSSTASAAELFTSALRDYNKCTVVGTTTYGKGCMQTIFPLSDGSAVKLTYRLFKPPFSESYHEVGITPDVTVELDEKLVNKNIFKFTDEEDNQLTEAVRSLNEFANK